MNDFAPIRAAARIGRPDQLTVLGFVTDPLSEAVLRDGLNDLNINGISNTSDIRRGTVKAATAAMMKMSAPQILVVDIGGDSRPLQSLLDLCDVIEPSIGVLVIGDVDDLDLYRAINRRIGAVDYILKPLTREMVARYFASLITNQAPTGDSTRGGRVIAITGARGGVGASTIASALAWFLGVDSNRHTLLLDTDPFIGAAEDQFGLRFEPALRDLLERAGTLEPQKLADAAKPVRNRLFALGSPPDPGCEPSEVAGAVPRIVEALRVRFNFIVIDLPFLPTRTHRAFLELTHHRVIVTEPSVAGLRDTLRLLALPNSPGQPQRPTILLNREGRPGGLRRKHMEDALKRKVDLSLGDHPKTFATLTASGRFGGIPKGPFSRLIHDLSREAGFEHGRKAEKT